MHSTIVARDINSYGTEEQKQRWLPGSATGELVGAVAMTEPGTGTTVHGCPSELDVPTASMAKWWTTQMQCDVADECLQFLGGYGYLPEYPITKTYTNARIQKIYGGTNEIISRDL